MNTTTGETGTIVDVHTKREPLPAFTVLPDGARKAVLWLGDAVKWEARERSPKWPT